MRFSAAPLAVMATSAAAWSVQERPAGFYWSNLRWGGWSGRVPTTIMAPSAVPEPTVPFSTIPVSTIPTPAVPTPDPVVDDSAEDATTMATTTTTIAITTTMPSPVATPDTADDAETAIASTTSTTTSFPRSSAGLSADLQNALDAHNAARAEVGNAPLVWDSSLAADAQQWADHLVSVGYLTHSQTQGQGENLYMQSSADAPNLNAANAWIAEKSQYHGEAISSSNYKTFGHYTQAVWKSTTNIGMAFATDSRGSTYVVARYSPPGNYIGQKPY